MKTYGISELGAMVLCPVFAGLTAVSPWFSIPCVVFALAWAFERYLQTKVDAALLVQLTEARDTNRATERRIKDMEEKIEKVQAAVSLRFGR